MSRKRRRRPPRPEYQAYIASDEWQAVRLRYFRSGLPVICLGRVDGEVCGKVQIDLHHWTYARLGSESLSDLVPLCRECHKRVHAEMRDNSRDELLRATDVVCGPGIAGRQKKRLRECENVLAFVPVPDKVRRLAGEAREAPRPPRSKSKKPIPARGYTKKKHAEVQLVAAYRAFGQAVKRDDSDALIRKRCRKLMNAALRAGRSDIEERASAYLANFKGKRAA